jgi:hypothetical protein
VQKKAEVLRWRIGYATLAFGFIFVVAMYFALLGYGEDGGRVATNALMEVALSLVSVGIVLIAIDLPVFRIQREAEEREKEEQRVAIERQQEERHIAGLREQLRSRVPGIAARASEQLQQLGWFWKHSLDDINLSGANLSGASLASAKMREIDAYDADFSRADLRYTDFTEADLRRSTFAESDLSGAKMIDANLDGVNFEDAFLHHVDFTAANLYRAKLKGAHIGEARVGHDGTEEEFELDGGTIFPAAKFDERTTLPDGTMWTKDTDMTKFTGVVDS